MSIENNGESFQSDLNVETTSFQFQFAFLADTHVQDSVDSSHSKRSMAVVTAIRKYNYKTVTNKYQWIAISGDLTNRAFSNEDQVFNAIWRDPSFLPGNPRFVEAMVGIGNHDLDSNPRQRADVLDCCLKKPNIMMKERYGQNDDVKFKLSCNQYHSHWVRKEHLNGKPYLFHFFVLNMLPGKGETDDSEAGRSKNPLRSLEFLQDELMYIPKGEPIFLFYHFCLEYPTTEETWPTKDRQTFFSYFKERGHNLVAVFNGHIHRFTSTTVGAYSDLSDSKKYLTQCAVIIGGGVTNGAKNDEKKADEKDRSWPMYYKCLITGKIENGVAKFELQTTLQEAYYDQEPGEAEERQASWNDANRDNSYTFTAVPTGGTSK